MPAWRISDARSGVCHCVNSSKKSFAQMVFEVGKEVCLSRRVWYLVQHLRHKATQKQHIDIELEYNAFEDTLSALSNF